MFRSITSALVFGMVFGTTMLARAETDLTVPTKTDVSVFFACFDKAGDAGARINCAGRTADECVTRAPGGYSTPMMEACMTREWKLWDRTLNGQYKVLMAQLTPDQQNQLRAAQKLWIPYRDSVCNFEMSLWEGGTGMGLAGITCQMQQTARRVVDFVGNLEQANGEGDE